jgi:protein-tyrosine phosphatase
VSPGDDGKPHLLVVCTANRCRSPLGAALLDRAVAAGGASAHVDSAGFAEPGRPATEATVQVAARRGLDLTEHRSRLVEPELAERAALVVAMERFHVQDVVLAAPSAWPRTFTLKEAVRRGEALGARHPSETLPSWVAQVHEGRQRRDLLGASPLDDVPDPTGGTLAEHEDTARELEDLTGRLADLLRLPDRPPIRWPSR